MIAPLVFAETDELYLTRLYANLLFREPLPDEYASRLEALRAGRAGRGAVAREILESPEFTGNGFFVAACYLGLMRRDPDLQGWRHHCRLIRTGVAQREIVHGFLTSKESSVLSLNFAPSDLVSLAYLRLLDRQPDTVGFHAWLAELASGREQPAGVILGILTSVEYQNKVRARALANLLHLGLLERDAASQQVEEWEKFIESRSLLEAVASFLSRLQAAG